jgi:dephospho-CoA kinase
LSVKVGLTGLWGSGKTTVLEMFRQLGAEVLDLDEVVHKLLNNEAIVEKIKDAFGQEVVKDGAIDRRALARRAFSSEQEIKRLEAIIHPEVFRKMLDFLNDVKGIAVVEVPLLYETSSERHFDRTALVRADEKVRTKRLLEKGYSLEEISQRLRHQVPEEEKARRADYVIDNSGSIEETRKQVMKIWEDLQNI